MTRTRSYIAWLLIAVLTLTGHSMAMARGASPVAGYLELCTGTGPVMVAIDSEGEPTGESHICPDFSLLLQVSLDGPVTLAYRQEGRREIVSWAAYGLNAKLVFLGQSARGPPVVF